MLYTRNAFYFRKFFAKEVARDRDRDLDLNFIAPLHPDKNRFEKGFAKLIYANRDDVGKFLTSTALKVAVDDQAIYELIQNADDCKSSFFSVSFNEKYLLCINNGNSFSDKDMSAIINIAANYKEGEDIGTFGIGFKILHRLVGKENGRDAIINDYAGPIIFSWNKYFQLEKFLNGEEIRIGGYDFEKKQYSYEKDQENAWLIKILYACFPSHLGEKVRLRDYETQEIKFEENELNEMREFLKNSLQNVNLQETNNLKSGSIFFLKLGEGKYKFLQDGIDKIKSGLSYSLKFLNSLTKIYIDGEEIKEQQVIVHSQSCVIGSNEFEFVNPENLNRDIKFTFAFHKYYNQSKSLREEIIPNLYTFFSMDDERNGFSFILHCNAFAMHNSRRFLEPTSDINQRLLPLIAKDITQYIEKQKDKNRELFLSLYANLLLSNEPKSKPHLNNYFFKFLKDYFHQNIPTQDNYSNTPENVKIKATYLPIQPSDFGCPEIEWFAWQNEKTDKALIDEARNSEKLHLEKWDIVNLLKYAISKGKIEIINEWVKQANEKHFADANNKDYTYLSFVQEIDKNILERDLPIISQIKLFKFSDGNYYSLNEVFANSNLVLIYDKVVKIKQELRFLGLVGSNLDISKNPNLLKLILPKINEENLFKAIAEKCKGNNLRAEHKHNLFFTIAEFERVGTEKLKDLELFKDTQGNIRPLRTLLKGDLQVPNWLFGFKVHRAEYIPELDKFLVKENEIYQAIIYKNWDFLIGQIQNIKDFYAQVTEYYKQNPDNPRLEKFACISTNEGFKKPEQVFFNSNLNSRNFDDLQNAIFKIANKPTPNKQVFSFLNDENSPFKISKNDKISSFITESYALSYSETLAILEFSKTNSERLFSIAYVQKQNDTFLLVKHSQSVFQYYSNRQEINELLSNQPNFKLLPKEFNANDFRELGVLQDKVLYMKVLQTLEFSENLLPIIRESDKEVQLAYFEKLKDFSLQEGKVYDKNSFEHHCLKLAIDCYADDFQSKFAPKILINEKLRLRGIAVKDDINFENITLSLASVLPDYKGVSDIITKIINQFTDFTKTELSEKVFPISNKKKDEIYSELTAKFPTLQNIEQFAFLLYYSKQAGKNFFTNQSLATLSSIDILQFAYKQKFTELTTFVNIGLQDKIYPSELALETEKLPTWVLTWLESTDKQEKLSFLSALGVHTENSNICAIRRFFQTGQSIDVQAKVVALSQGLLLNTLKWLQGTTFKFSESTKLEGLKQIFSRLTYSNEIPLLYVSQITASEILYNLEVSSVVKYYFEIPQKEYKQKIFAVLQSKSFKLIALDYFKHWQSNIPSLNKIQTTSPLDIITLKNDSVEWDDSAYNQWKANQKYKVAIYKGEKLPYKVLFLETEIDIFAEGTSIEKEGVIYVCQSVKHDIRNTLSKYINADELIKLYQLDNNSSDIVQTLQSRISQLEEVITNLLSGNKNDDWKNSDTFFDDFNQVVTEREFNLITGYKAEAYVYEQLKSQGFKNVVWTNQANTQTNQKIVQSGKTYFIDEKGEPYDLTFIDDKGQLCYVQVKATTTTFDRADDVKMIITKREWLFLQKDENKDVYYMTRVFGARDYPSMKFFKMELKVGT